MPTFPFERNVERNIAQFEPTYTQLTAFLVPLQLIEPVKPLPALRGWAAPPNRLLEIAKYTLENMSMATIECSSGHQPLFGPVLPADRTEPCLQSEP